MLPHQIPNLATLNPTPYCSLPSTAVATTPYLSPKCLLIVYFALLVSSIALLLTSQRTVMELRIRPITITGLILVTEQVQVVIIYSEVDIIKLCT